MTEIDEDIPVDADTVTDPVLEPESFPLPDFGSETESESFSEIVPIFDSDPIIPEPPIVIPEPPITTTNISTAEYTEIEISESMTVKELRSIADELGIKVPKSASKKKILELLNTT